MKEKNHSLHIVKLDEVRTFLAELLGSQEIASARCQGSATSWDVEAIESTDAEFFVKERISLFLKAAVGACDNERMRPVRRPFGVQ